jgi:hypothetical protein
MYYRRKWGTTVWHSSPDCPNWPQSALEAEERADIPSNGEACADCARRARMPMRRSARMRGGD